MIWILNYGKKVLLVRIHCEGKFIPNHNKHPKGMGSLSEEVKIGKSKVFNYKKLVAIIHDLGYNEFYMLSKAWDKDYD